MNDDELLREAISDAVADVEPTDRLTEIRRATAHRPRRGWYAVGGASVLAAAATVTAFAVLGSNDTPRAADVATNPSSGPSSVSSTAADPASPTTPPTAPTTTEPPAPPDSQPVSAVPVYFLGPASSGPDSPSAFLYREFLPGAGHDPLPLLMAGPQDPDYTTMWEPGSLASSSATSDLITVVLGESARAERPAGVSERQAELGVEQVVYSVQAQYGGRLPVRLVGSDGQPMLTVLGVPTNEPLANAPELDVLSHMSITDPAEGAAYSGSFTASGVSNGFEASVYCQLIAPDGTQAFAKATSAEGWSEPRLFPWKLKVKLADVAPGTYTFTCSTDDPAGGADGYGAATDTRTVTVE